MIAGRLQSDEKAGARERPTDNLKAYEAYLRGRFYFAKGASGDYAKSVDLYERAIELDPEFAEAYAGLAEAWNEWAHVEEPTDRFPRAKANALKALELDPTLADAHATLGNVHFLFDWDWNGAIESFERAIELNPNSAKAHQHYVTLLGNLGRVDEAIEHGLQSVALDPLSPHANHAAAFAHFQAQRFEESLEYDERALELAPDYHIANVNKGMALMEAGRLDEAEDQFQHMLEAWPDAPFTRACLAQVYDRTGRRELAIEQVRAIEDHPGPNRGHVAHDAAWTHAALGNVEEALDWIDRALEARDPFMVGLACFYTWDPLRSDPRFQAVLRKMDFPEWSYREAPSRSSSEAPRPR